MDFNLKLMQYHSFIAFVIGSKDYTATPLGLLYRQDIKFSIFEIHKFGARYQIKFEINFGIVKQDVDEGKEVRTCLKSLNIHLH